MVTLALGSSGEPRRRVHQHPGNWDWGPTGRPKQDPRFPAGLPPLGCPLGRSLLCIMLLRPLTPCPLCRALLQPAPVFSLRPCFQGFNEELLNQNLYLLIFLTTL